MDEIKKTRVDGKEKRSQDSTLGPLTCEELGQERRAAGKVGGKQREATDLGSGEVLEMEGPTSRIRPPDLWLDSLGECHHDTGKSCSGERWGRGGEEGSKLETCLWELCCMGIRNVGQELKMDVGPERREFAEATSLRR